MNGSSNYKKFVVVKSGYMLETLDRLTVLLFYVKINSNNQANRDNQQERLENDDKKGNTRTNRLVSSWLC